MTPTAHATQFIPAIPSVYRNCEYKSRLEAHWAVFFDEHGVEFVYEPHRLLFADGVVYIPDFYLPDLSTWFEVKGNPSRSAQKKPLLLWEKVAPKGQRVAVGLGEGQVSVPYRLDDDVVSYDGAVIRCSGCRAVWFANPKDPQAANCPHCNDKNGGRAYVVAATAAIEGGLKPCWLGDHNPFDFKNIISKA